MRIRVILIKKKNYQFLQTQLNLHPQKHMVSGFPLHSLLLRLMIMVLTISLIHCVKTTNKILFSRCTVLRAHFAPILHTSFLNIQLYPKKCFLQCLVSGSVVSLLMIFHKFENIRYWYIDLFPLKKIRWDVKFKQLQIYQVFGAVQILLLLRSLLHYFVSRRPGLFKLLHYAPVQLIK